MAEKLAHSKDILQAGLATGASAPIVTRVERQCTGKAIPKNLSTLGGLIEHAADADPLPALVCSQTGTDRIAHDNWPPRKWLMSLGLAAAVRDFGEAEVRARLNRSGGNAKRVFDNYSDLLLCDSVGVTEAQLRDEYRRGTIRQLNVPVEGPDGEITYPAGGFSLTL